MYTNGVREKAFGFCTFNVVDCRRANAQWATVWSISFFIFCVPVHTWYGTVRRRSCKKIVWITKNEGSPARFQVYRTPQLYGYEVACHTICESGSPGELLTFPLLPPPLPPRGLSCPYCTDTIAFHTVPVQLLG